MNEVHSILGTSSLDLVNSASSAITALDTAIQTVSTNRANLGAVQNRLEYRISILSVAAENLSASESRIRDARPGQARTFLRSPARSGRRLLSGGVGVGAFGGHRRKG